MKDSSFSSSGNPLRFRRPTQTANRVDEAVKQVVFEEDAPRLTSGTGVDTQTRSVVVNRDEMAQTFRSAQLQPTGAPAAGQLPKPAADSNATPQLEEPIFDEPAPAKDPMSDAKTNTSPSEPAQPPKSAASPQASPPPAGQFQPVLPSGPMPPSPIETGPAAPLTPTATIEGEKGTAKESCEKSLENLRAYTVDKVKLNIGINGAEGKDYPFECTIDDGQQYKPRCWEQTTYMWKASAMCHKPLYFEDEQLERYGHSFTPCIQPFVSGAHFFCTLPVLPYCMGVEPPCECIYALGHYRPGSCAPYMCNPVPLSWRGAVIQAGAVTGAAAALP